MEPTRAQAAAPLEERLRGALTRRPKQSVEAPHRTAAAVLLMLFEREGEPWLVFTKRTHHVQHHKGEISFPGGARDSDDPDLRATAIRETVEELGVDPAGIRIVGELDDVPTFLTGYLVTPFVAVIPEQHSYVPSGHEIEEVIELPVAELAAVGREEVLTRRGRPFATHVFEARGHTIWGLTGGILRQFLDDVWTTLARESRGAGRDAET